MNSPWWVESTLCFQCHKLVLLSLLSVSVVQVANTERHVRLCVRMCEYENAPIYFPLFRTVPEVTLSIRARYHSPSSENEAAHTSPSLYMHDTDSDDSPFLLSAVTWSSSCSLLYLSSSEGNRSWHQNWPYEESSVTVHLTELSIQLTLHS